MSNRVEAGLINCLREDGVNSEETAVLLPVLQQLSKSPSPPTATETEVLLARLLPELPAAASDFTQRRRNAQGESWLWLLLLAQLRVVGRSIWAASALVMALGVVVSLVWQGVGGMAGLPLALLAPIVAALGIATLYNPADGVWELEMTTAVPLQLLLLARLLLVFGFDLLLAVGGSAILTLFLPQVDLWLLVTTWLAPMTFLAALAFFITVLSGKVEVSIFTSLSLWALQVVRLAGDNLGQFALYWPDLLSPDSHSWLWTLALVGIILALWLGGREERGIVIGDW